MMIYKHHQSQWYDNTSIKQTETGPGRSLFVWKNGNMKKSIISSLGKGSVVAAKRRAAPGAFGPGQQAPDGGGRSP